MKCDALLLTERFSLFYAKTIPKIPSTEKCVQRRIYLCFWYIFFSCRFSEWNRAFHLRFGCSHVLCCAVCGVVFVVRIFSVCLRTRERLSFLHCSGNTHIFHNENWALANKHKHISSSACHIRCRLNHESKREEGERETHTHGARHCVRVC